MKKYLIVAVIALLQACAVGPQFHVNVDSISAPEAASKTKYILLPGVKGLFAFEGVEKI